MASGLRSHAAICTDQVGTEASLLSLQRPPGGPDVTEWNVVPVLRGSASRIVVTRGTDGEDPFSAHREVREVLAGPPVGPVSLLVANERFGIGNLAAGTTPPDVSGDLVIAVEHEQTSGPFQAMVRNVAAPGAAPLPLGPLETRDRAYVAARVAGSWAAVDQAGVITVLDRQSGQPSFSITTGAKDESQVPFDVQDDGTLVARVPRTGTRGYDLVAASPAAPLPHVVAADVDQRTSPLAHPDVRVAAGRVAYTRGSDGHLMLAPVSGGEPVEVSDVAVNAFDYDGQRVAFITNCAFVGPAPTSQSDGPLRRTTCTAMKLATELPLSWDSSASTLTVRPRCVGGPPSGCHGSIVVDGRGRHSQLVRIAESTFDIPTGTSGAARIPVSPKRLAKLRTTGHLTLRLRVTARATGWGTRTSTSGGQLLLKNPDQ